MMERYPLGDFKPDMPDIGNDGLVSMRGGLPIAGGYGPMPSWNAITAFPPLPITPPDDFVRGAIQGLDYQGNPFNFAGSSQSLWKIDATGTNEVSKIDDGYNATDLGRWEFIQFGNDIFAANIRDPLQVLNLKSAAGDFEDVPPEAPRFAHLGVVGPHVMGGRYFDAFSGDVPNGIAWCAINNPRLWPIPGTNEAISLQSDRQGLEGNGGYVQGVIGGAEVGIIFQERAIWRADYRGGQVMYELTRVEPNRGLLIPGVASAIGRAIFYVSEDGFYLFDYTTSQPIGNERLDRTFLADVDSAFFHRCSAAVDPDRKLIFVLYPGRGNVGGAPNKCLVYNWSLNQFAIAFSGEDISYIVRALDVGVHLDSPSNPPDDPDVDQSDPDNPPYDDSGVDGTNFLPNSWDQRQSAFGEVSFGAYDGSAQIGRFNGPAYEAFFETGDRELVVGRRSMTQSVRPIVTGSDAVVSVGGSARSNQKEIKFTREKRMQIDGRCPVRVDGRYHRFRVRVPSGNAAGSYRDIMGFDVDFMATGMR